MSTHQQAQRQTLSPVTFARRGAQLSRIARRTLLALAAVGVLGNLVFLLVADRLASEAPLAATPGQSEALVLAKAMDEQRVLTANRANEVTLLEGGQPIAAAQFDNLIGDLAITPDGTRAYVGTSDGIVSVLDGDLTALDELEVTGRVVGLEVTGDGGAIVGHGVGAFGDRYWVSHFPDPTGDPAFTTQVDFAISGVAVLGAHAVYGTQDSRVGAINLATGERIWTTTLRSPVTRLVAIPERAQMLAGSENGDVALLDEQGDILWNTNVSSYPVRGLGFDDATSSYVAGDSRGSVVVLDAAGSVIFREDVGTADIQTVTPTTNAALLLVPREGPWQTLHLGAIDAAQQASQVRTAWVAFNVVLVLAAISAVIVAVERLRAATGRRFTLIWRARLAYGFLLPAVALIIFFAYYPAGLAFYYSLTNFSLRTITEFIGLENYRRVLFEDTYFRTGMLNMGIIVVASILKTITMPLIAAQLVFWLRNTVHQYIFRTLFILPAVVPDLVFTLMWQQVYNPNTGFLNQLLTAIGLPQYRRAWLGDEQTALWAVIGVGFPFVSAFAFLIFLGGLLNINPEYFDAAKVDGARWWSRFLHIDVPLLLPQFRILLFFAIVGTVQGFASIFILTRGGPGTATYVPALQMYLRISDGDFGYASAIGVVLFVMILLMTLFILRFRRNEAVETA